MSTCCAPHTSGFSIMTVRQTGSFHMPATVSASSVLIVVRSGGVGHGEVDHRARPALGLVAHRLDGAVADVPDDAVHVERSRVIRSVTVSTVPVASPTVITSPTPYWSSTSMKTPDR